MKHMLCFFQPHWLIVHQSSLTYSFNESIVSFKILPTAQWLNEKISFYLRIIFSVNSLPKIKISSLFSLRGKSKSIFNGQLRKRDVYVNNYYYSLCVSLPHLIDETMKVESDLPPCSSWLIFFLSFTHREKGHGSLISFSKREKKLKIICWKGN